ncbi:MAG: hypothetical protein Q7U40_01995 [Desulfatirhabdiaceae bacterium]|nr:hypothetical protein [Desulfatirhabdiaceae bacterium]
MKSEDDYSKDVAALDRLIAEITLDTYSQDEQLWAFRQVIEDEVSFPCQGHVIGEPMTVIGIDYDGNERRGLTAKCRRTDGTEYIVAASDVVLSGRSAGDRFIASYRKWLGIESFPSTRNSLNKETLADLYQGDTVELAVLSATGRTARCRILANDRVVTFRAKDIWDVAPGEIMVVSPRKWWRYAGHPYLSGEIVSTP